MKHVHKGKRFWGFISFCDADNREVMHQSIPPPPPADPRALAFFCLGWQIPGSGDSGAVKSPGVGTIKEGKCPVLRQHRNSFSLIEQSKSAILSILMCDFLFLLMSSFAITLGF